MSIATIDDVAIRAGLDSVPDATRSQIRAWLDDVDVLICSRIPDYAERVTTGRIPKRVAVMVECRAVIRKLANPEGKTSEQIDDYSMRFSEGFARGEVFLTDEEWGLLDPHLGKDTGGAFGISTLPAHLTVRRTDTWRS